MHLFIILYALVGSVLALAMLVHLNRAFLLHLVGLCLCQLGLVVTDGGMRLAQFGAGIADCSGWFVSVPAPVERPIPVSEEGEENERVVFIEVHGRDSLN